MSLRPHVSYHGDCGVGHFPIAATYVTIGVSRIEMMVTEHIVVGVCMLVVDAVT